MFSQLAAGLSQPPPPYTPANRVGHGRALLAAVECGGLMGAVDRVLDFVGMIDEEIGPGAIPGQQSFEALFGITRDKYFAWKKLATYPELEVRRSGGWAGAGCGRTRRLRNRVCMTRAGCVLQALARQGCLSPRELERYKPGTTDLAALHARAGHLSVLLNMAPSDNTQPGQRVRGRLPALGCSCSQR